MKNLEIVLAQQPGVVTFSNFEEVKSALNKKLSIEYSTVTRGVSGWSFVRIKNIRDFSSTTFWS